MGDIQPSLLNDVKQSTGATNPAVGYMYSEFGAFWLNIWTWNGKFVVYQGDTVWDVTPEQAANFMGITTDALSPPLSYSVPPGLVILAILVIAFGLFWFFSRKEEKEEQTAPHAPQAG